jgi:hypothetical protein
LRALVRLALKCESADERGRALRRRHQRSAEGKRRD